MNSALITTTALTLLALVVGGLLKHLAWSGRKPCTPVEHGRVFFSYAALAVPLLLVHLLGSKDAVNDLMALFLLVTACGALVFAFGFLYGFLKNRQTDSISGNTDAAYAQALAEVEQNNLVRATWAKALIKCDGNDARAKSVYIQDRMMQISRASIVLPADPGNEEEQAEDDEDRFRTIVKSVMVVAIAALAAGSVYWFIQQGSSIQFAKITRMFSSPTVEPLPGESALAQAPVPAPSPVRPAPVLPLSPKPDEHAGSEGTVSQSNTSNHELPAGPTMSVPAAPTPAAPTPVPATTPSTSQPDASSAQPGKPQATPGQSSLIGEWRCIDDEDVIDRFDANGIYRRTWVKQKVDLIYKWLLTKEGSTTVLVRTDIADTPSSKIKLLVLSLSSDQLELLYPSGRSEKCKPVKAKPRAQSRPAETPPTAASNPMLKELLGKWQRGPWHFNYMADGQGEISHNGGMVCGTFAYALKENKLSASNFSGECKQAGVSGKITCSVDMKGSAMTLKCENGHSTEWIKTSL